VPRIDLTLPELWDYKPELPEPPGFDAFWSKTLAEQSAYALDVTLEPVDNGLVAVETFDVTFAGYGGDPVRGWLHLPAPALRGTGTGTDRLPGVVQFQGYNGGRGLPHEHVFWALAGYAHLVMDTRGQGSGWTTGATGDPHGSGPSAPGFLTRGIGRPEDHFYRRVFVDAVRAVEVLRGHDLVDDARVAVTGISQGGGTALAAGALADGVAAVMPDVPFLCDFRRAADLPTLDPYAEIGRYLAAHRDEVAAVFDTLAHFDGALMARRATAPALFSVAVMDTVCPPSTVFAAYHSYRAAKEIAVYEFNDHEGGGPFQQARQAAWLAKVLR